VGHRKALFSLTAFIGDKLPLDLLFLGRFGFLKKLGLLWTGFKVDSEPYILSVMGWFFIGVILELLNLWKYFLEVA